MPPTPHEKPKRHRPAMAPLVQRRQRTTLLDLYEETNATNPPVIESDSEGNLYLIRVDFVKGNASLYRFLASEPYHHPTQTLIPNGAAGKYAMAIDEEPNQIHFLRPQ